MEELTIKVRINNKVINIPEAIAFLDIPFDQINYKPRLYEYLFSWDKIPGNDSEKLINFLNQKYRIDWVKTAEIIKTDDGKTIRASFETNFVSLIINNERTKVNLRINDGRTDELEAEKEDGNSNIYLLLSETRSQDQILLEYYTANPLELRIPNQFLYLTFKKNLPFDLEEKEYEFLIEHIITEELELDGEIRKIKSNGETPQSKKYSVGLKVEEISTIDNINKCSKINELILVKGFNTTTDYGKVSSADISQHVLAITPKKLDCRIINKLLLNGDNVTYICFSDIIYKKFTDILKNEEFVSLPQVDFSEYVNELYGIIRTQLFRKNCSAEYPLDIFEELENFKKGIYGDKLWIAIENILRNISERNGYTGNSLGNYLDNLSSDTSERRLFDETKCLIMALGRNNLAHAKLVRSNSDQKYLVILCMKALRDVYLNWCFFQSLDKCFTKMQSGLNTSSKELWEIYNGKKQYLFSWDEIPGNDSKLIGFLKLNYGIDWVKTAEIKKIDDGNTIRASFEANYVSLILNNDNTKAKLRINDGRTDEFEAKREDGKLKIYYKKIKITVDYSGEWDSDTQMKIKFENSSTKESKTYFFNINLDKDKIEVIQ